MSCRCFYQKKEGPERSCGKNASTCVVLKLLLAYMTHAFFKPSPKRYSSSNSAWAALMASTEGQKKSCVHVQASARWLCTGANSPLFSHRLARRLSPHFSHSVVLHPLWDGSALQPLGCTRAPAMCTTTSARCTNRPTLSRTSKIWRWRGPT